MRWRRLGITILIIAPVLALLGYGFTRDAHYIVSPLIAKPAAPFTVALFNGRKLTLDDLSGKAVFVNFWAVSWRVPCREEARELEAAWQKIKDKNMVFPWRRRAGHRRAIARVFEGIQHHLIRTAKTKRAKSPSITALGAFRRASSLIRKAASPTNTWAQSARRW